MPKRIHPHSEYVTQEETLSDNSKVYNVVSNYDPDFIVPAQSKESAQIIADCLNQQPTTAKD